MLYVLRLLLVLILCFVLIIGFGNGAGAATMIKVTTTTTVHGTVTTTVHGTVTTTVPSTATMFPSTAGGVQTTTTTVHGRDSGGDEGDGEFGAEERDFGGLFNQDMINDLNNAYQQDPCRLYDNRFRCVGSSQGAAYFDELEVGGDTRISGFLDVRTPGPWAIVSIRPEQWEREDDIAEIHLGDSFHRIGAAYGWAHGGMFFEDNTAFRFNLAGLDALAMRRSGDTFRVGIGTDSPRRTLDVRGRAVIGSAPIEGFGRNQAVLDVVDNVNSARYIRIANRPEGDSDENKAGFIATAKGTNAYLRANGKVGNERGLIELGTTASYTDVAINPGTEVMRITTTSGDRNEGRVGIGTTNPAVKLDVDGGIRVKAGESKGVVFGNDGNGNPHDMYRIYATAGNMHYGAPDTRAKHTFNGPLTANDGEDFIIRLAPPPQEEQQGGGGDIGNLGFGDEGEREDDRA